MSLEARIAALRTSPRARRRAGRLLRRVVFAMVPAALLLAAGELGARRLPEAAITTPKISQVLTPHPQRLWSLPPGGGLSLGENYEVGPDGLRTAAQTGAPRRALTLGDSSIFGAGLTDDDTLHAQLAAALGARGEPTDVICGAISGYSTEQSLVLMDEMGWDLQPDLLVIGNLWSDLNQDGFVDREWMDALGSPARRLMHRSALMRRLYATLRTPDDRSGLPVSWARAPLPEGDLARRVPLSDYARNLDRLLLDAAARGVGAAMLSPCNRFRLARPDQPASWDPYFDVMSRVAARRNTPVVSGCALIRDAGLTPDDAFLDELHPRAGVNGMYAAALADQVVTRGWSGLIPDPNPAPFDEDLDDPWTEPAPRSGGPAPPPPPLGPDDIPEDGP